MIYIFCNTIILTLIYADTVQYTLKNNNPGLIKISNTLVYTKLQIYKLKTLKLFSNSLLILYTNW